MFYYLQFRDQSVRRLGGDISNLYNTTVGNVQPPIQLRNYSGITNPTILGDIPINSQSNVTKSKLKTGHKSASSRSR